MRMVRIWMLSLMLVCAAPSYASTEYGFVKWVGVRASDGLVIFALTTNSNPHFPPTTRTTKPACATAGYWVIRDENSAAGARQYDALMRARAANLVVTIVGAGTCARWPDGEDADFVQVNENVL
jgi:hypothetical protein